MKSDLSLNDRKLVGEAVKFHVLCLKGSNVSLLMLESSLTHGNRLQLYKVCKLCQLALKNTV